MDHETCSSSSLYSDEPFYLENLLTTSPSQDPEDSTETIEKLKQEAAALESQVGRMKDCWLSICHTLELSGKIGYQIELSCTRGANGILVEQNKWIACHKAF
jgi:hypothetical protein